VILLPSDRAPGDVVARSKKAAYERRQAEGACALHFLVYGDEDTPHRERCLFAREGRDPCSRTYDPLPAGTEPPDPRLYAGTGIGLLYGMGGESHAWQLAGWNLDPRSTR
jgi:hypothetical protein